MILYFFTFFRYIKMDDKQSEIAINCDFSIVWDAFFALPCVFRQIITVSICLKKIINIITFVSRVSSTSDSPSENSLTHKYLGWNCHRLSSDLQYYFNVSLTTKAKEFFSNFICCCFGLGKNWFVGNTFTLFSHT